MGTSTKTQRHKERPHKDRFLCGLSLCLCVFVVTAFGAGKDLRLVEAAKAKDAAAVRSLLKSGVDVNNAQGDGATALHWAVHHDDLATTDLLLQAGSRANGATALW